MPRAPYAQRRATEGVSEQMNGARPYSTGSNSDHQTGSMTQHHDAGETMTATNVGFGKQQMTSWRNDSRSTLSNPGNLGKSNIDF